VLEIDQIGIRGFVFGAGRETLRQFDLAAAGTQAQDENLLGQQQRRKFGVFRNRPQGFETQSLDIEVRGACKIGHITGDAFECGARAHGNAQPRVLV
jgi:hypothetical protein